MSTWPIVRGKTDLLRLLLLKPQRRTDARSVWLQKKRNLSISAVRHELCLNAGTSCPRRFCCIWRDARVTGLLVLDLRRTFSFLEFSLETTTIYLLSAFGRGAFPVERLATLGFDSRMFKWKFVLSFKRLTREASSLRRADRKEPA